MQKVRIIFLINKGTRHQQRRKKKIDENTVTRADPYRSMPRSPSLGEKNKMAALVHDMITTLFQIRLSAHWAITERKTAWKGRWRPGRRCAQPRNAWWERACPASCRRASASAWTAGGGSSEAARRQAPLSGMYVKLMTFSNTQIQIFWYIYSDRNIVGAYVSGPELDMDLQLIVLSWIRNRIGNTEIDPDPGAMKMT